MRRAVSPADGSEQGGAGLVVEGDDDAGGREVRAVHQQGASGEGKAGGHIRPWGRSRVKCWNQGHCGRHSMDGGLVPGGTGPAAQHR